MAFETTERQLILLGQVFSYQGAFIDKIYIFLGRDITKSITNK